MKKIAVGAGSAALVASIAMYGLNQLPQNKVYHENGIEMVNVQGNVYVRDSTEDLLEYIVKYKRPEEVRKGLLEVENGQ